MALALPDQLAQLEAARQIVLGDAALYPQIVAGILPIVGANARLELRRWGAEFLAETFASPTFAPQPKEHSAVGILGILKDLLEIPQEDASVVKSVIQTVASIYGLVFRYIIENPHDVPVWNQIASIKSNILKRWDTAPTGVRVCCIKFVQKVVQLQTPGPIADPRRTAQNEVSLALVPRDHPLIPPSKLEPEASGLLDRLLNVFQEEQSDAVLIDATLNCLSPLVRTRQSIANKIVSVILNFNPLKQANSSINPKLKIQIKSMERTTRAFLMNIYRRNENGPFASRIKAYVDRLIQTRVELLDEGGSKKRGLPNEPTDGLDNAKRRRLGAELPDRTAYPTLSPGPKTLKEVYTLTTDQDLANFDVSTLPLNLVFNIALPMLSHVDQQAFDLAINHVRARFVSLASVNGATTQVGALGDDEEDYEPDFEPREDREQVINKADALPFEENPQVTAEVALGPFKFPQPPPMLPEESEQIGRGIVSRVFNMMNVPDEPSNVRRQRPGLNRLAGSNSDKSAWLTILMRLGTRASAGLDGEADFGDERKTMVNKHGSPQTINTWLKEKLRTFIIEDFRARIGVAIAWLNEEWFNDRIQKQAAEERKDGKKALQPKRDYEKWMLSVLDGIMPYLDAKDKLLIKFLSEIPEVNEHVIERVKKLARDPERVQLAVRTLLYLATFKIPARKLAVDALEDLWRNYDDAKAPAAKALTKWRPEILPPESKPLVVPAINGTPKLEGSQSPSYVPAGGLGQSEQVNSNQAGLPVAAAG